MVFRYLALALFLLYVAVFPGSTLTVALDRVPAWGVWFGAALLFVQGGALLAWLAAEHGARGLAAALLIGALAFAVEYVGVTTGWPFGRYVYTPVLQPQIAGTVPLAICFAWLMVVPCAWEAARRLVPPGRGRWPALLVSASLVLLLDLQIETVAAHINGYWRWFDGGPYHGVPTQNFAAWWAVGLALSALLERLTRATTNNQRPTTNDEGLDRRQKLYHEAHEEHEDQVPQRSCASSAKTHLQESAGICVPSAASAFPSPTLSVLGSRLSARLPVLLYLLSTVMFTVVNLARGYTLAGLVGLGALAGAAGLRARGRAAAGRAPPRRRSD
jgi:putative membrane protein